jgi:hypothetical protein
MVCKRAPNVDGVTSPILCEDFARTGIYEHTVQEECKGVVYSLVGYSSVVRLRVQSPRKTKNY